MRKRSRTSRVCQEYKNVPRFNRFQSCQSHHRQASPCERKKFSGSHQIYVKASENGSDFPSLDSNPTEHQNPNGTQFFPSGELRLRSNFMSDIDRNSGKMPKLFKLDLPQMEEASRLNKEKKEKLRSELLAAISSLGSLTFKMASKKDASSSSSPLSSNDESKALLEAVGEELTGELTKLWDNSNLSTPREKHAFEKSRSAVQSLWEEYRRVFAVLVRRAAAENAKKKSSSKRRS